MNVALGCDHAGLELKNYVRDFLRHLKINCTDFGCYDSASVDYPDIGGTVSSSVSDGTYDRGILICGSGIGMSIVANKYKGVRAALCSDVLSAQLCRHHNDANILVLAGRMIGKDLAKAIIDKWLTTNFDGGRHKNRIDKIKHIEEGLYK